MFLHSIPTFLESGLQLETHRVSNESLTAAALVLLLLAADVVEGEQQVVSLRQTGWKSYLHFLVEVWGPERVREEGSDKGRNAGKEGWPRTKMEEER